MGLQTRLFVGNLPENTNENDLQRVFSVFGEIVNLDLKRKSAEDATKKNFAFVTLSASNYEIESCIKHFSNQNFKGNKLYVTRARESFLERLEREREQAKQKDTEKKSNHLPKKNPVIKLGDKLNPRKRKLDHSTNEIHENTRVKHLDNDKNIIPPHGDGINKTEDLKKHEDADKKRLESLKKKRQEFKEKQKIIKTGLIGIDSVPNKKTFFDSDDETTPSKTNHHNFDNNIVKRKGNTYLFDGDDSDDEVNFEIKKQYEGKKGQKVLDLQSRYKSDKRFVLDERFIEDDQSEDEKDIGIGVEDCEKVDVGQEDEKTKQLNILQDVLGVTIKTRTHNESVNSKKIKSKLGMLRFDPRQPEHAKFLAPADEKPEPAKKLKKKKSKEKEVEVIQPETPAQEAPKVEVSKEQFYKVSETLKEAIAQPTTFSLRSLFGNNEDDRKDESKDQEENYIPLETSKSSKVKNPLDRGDKNPFIYDSSDSEADNTDNFQKEPKQLPGKSEVRAVWRENLFFTKSDHRLKEGLVFFNKTNENEGQKERRELKSLMKKRIYNKERKNQMFQKKIGGRKKTMKKSYRKNS